MYMGGSPAVSHEMQQLIDANKKRLEDEEKDPLKHLSRLIQDVIDEKQKAYNAFLRLGTLQKELSCLMENLRRN